MSLRVDKVGMVEVYINPVIKYLGIWLDTKHTFAERIKRTTCEAKKNRCSIIDPNAKY